MPIKHSVVGERLRTLPSGARRIVGVVLAVQVALPLAVLATDPPSRFGWQMYSGVGEVPSIVVEMADGERRSVAFGDVAAAARPELDWSRYLPPYLCDRYPTAAIVELEYTANTRAFACEGSTDDT